MRRKVNPSKALFSPKKEKKISPKKLDDLWSEVVKNNAGNKCEYCSKTTGLNSHHIFSRSNFSVRWEPSNGICLCVAHHVFSSGFSAHKTPSEFTDFVQTYKGDDWYNKLRLQAHTPYKPNYKLVKERLENELKKYD